MLLELSKIRRDGGTQPRSCTDPMIVQEYAEAMERGEVFPDVRAVFDGTDYWLVDGFHRVEAMEQRDQTEIGCEILQGTQADAQWMSYSVNARHGQPRTRWDLQRAIAAALQHPMCSGLSDRAIADHIGCDHKTVGAQRKKLEETGEVTQSDTRTTSDGRTMNTAGINANRGATSVTVPLIQPPEGGWPARDEDGCFPTEVAEPIFENKGHAQAAIHVLEIEPERWQPSTRRWIANAALVGVSGCELSMPLKDRYGQAEKTRQKAIAGAAQKLAEHILRCLQNDKLPEGRQSALRHFFAWADTQGADVVEAEAEIKKEAEDRELAYDDEAEDRELAYDDEVEDRELAYDDEVEQVLNDLAGLVDPRYSEDRKGAYDWAKFVGRMNQFLAEDVGFWQQQAWEFVNNLEVAAEHFALIVAAAREFKSRKAAA